MRLCEFVKYLTEQQHNMTLRQRWSGMTVLLILEYISGRGQCCEAL